MEQAGRLLWVVLVVVAGCGDRRAMAPGDDGSPGRGDTSGVDLRPADDHAAPVPAPDSALPTANTACEHALLVPLVHGKAEVAGDTSLSQNEYGSAINCGFDSASARVGPMAGPQLYYRFRLVAGQGYRFVLQPTSLMPFALYLFRGCGPAQINADCGSEGVSGAAVYPKMLVPGATLVFTPSTSGEHILAVDSINPIAGGPFSLVVTAFTPPDNATCAAARTLTLKNGKATAFGDTTGASNEFEGLVHCGIEGAGPVGGQVYYRALLVHGKSYKFRVTSYGGPLGFYLFGDSCAPDQIDLDCGSEGKTGLVAGPDPLDSPVPVPFASSTSTAVFTPAATGPRRLAVEAIIPGTCGPFKLEVDAL